MVRVRPMCGSVAVSVAVCVCVAVCVAVCVRVQHGCGNNDSIVASISPARQWRRNDTPLQRKQVLALNALRAQRPMYTTKSRARRVMDTHPPHHASLAHLDACHRLQRTPRAARLLQLVHVGIDGRGPGCCTVDAARGQLRAA